MTDKDRSNEILYYEKEFTDLSEKINKTHEPLDNDKKERERDLIRMRLKEETNDPLIVFLFNVAAKAKDIKWYEESMPEQNIFNMKVITFVAEMLELFDPIERQAKRERDYLEMFALGSTRARLSMLGEAIRGIEHYYSNKEVNTDYYKGLMNSADAAIVTNAIISDWRNALMRKVYRRKAKVLQDHVEAWMRTAFVDENMTAMDREEYRAIENIYYSMPELEDIVRRIGRQELSKEKKWDDYYTDYLPVLPSVSQPAAEEEIVMMGQDIKYMLPLELGILAGRDTESLFYLRFARHQLQLFANKPKLESAKKKEKKKERPSLEKGPIIVSIDTSDSMTGYPLLVAYSLLVKLIELARKQHRACFLISFSVYIQTLNLTTYYGQSQLRRFMSRRYCGATDGEQMLRKSMEMLNTNQYSMADVLMISDFQVADPKSTTLQGMIREKQKGTSFYGLMIGHGSESYERILDKIWKVSSTPVKRVKGIWM